MRDPSKNQSTKNILDEDSKLQALKTTNSRHAHERRRSSEANALMHN